MYVRLFQFRSTFDIRCPLRFLSGQLRLTSQLKSRVCLVTGGASGIGKATALALIDAGAIVYVADIVDQRIADLRAAHQSPNLNIDHVNVCDPDAVNGWVGKVQQDQGRVDVFVHCAIHVDWQPFQQQSADSALKTMRVGFDAMVHCTKAILPLMHRNGFGRLVYVSSIVSTMHLFPGYAAYAATKSATDAWANILRMELRNTKVEIATVRPGIVAETNLFRHSVDRKTLPRLFDFLPKTTPQGVASTILRAITKSNRAYVTPSIYRVLDFLCRCAPRLSRWMCRWGTSCRTDIVMRGDDDN